MAHTGINVVNLSHFFNVYLLDFSISMNTKLEKEWKELEKPIQNDAFDIHTRKKNKWNF